MNDNEFVESLKDTRPPLPEAPESLHIDGYYKGFHVGLTKRALDAQIKPYAQDAMQAVDWLIEHDWKPSWNTETNHAQTSLLGQRSVPQSPTKECLIHNVAMKQKLSKKSGKTYFSHFRGTWAQPDFEVCYGQGYPSEKQQHEYEGA